MTTYSISSGVTYTEKRTDLLAVLKLLPDNTQKLIEPRDVRDSIYTAWENIVFKLTNAPGTDEYVGIDNPIVQKKILIGKKTVDGLPVMDSNLMAEDVDIYFYNTKTEPTSNYNTKIGILSGTGPFYFEGNWMGSYIESRTINLLNGPINVLEIRNTSYALFGSERVGGDISIKSDKGNISLNDFVFPRIDQNNISTNVS